MPSLEVSALFGGHPLSSEGTGYAPKRHCGAKFFTACFLAKQAVPFVPRTLLEQSPHFKLSGRVKVRQIAAGAMDNDGQRYLMGESIRWGGLGGVFALMTPN